MVNECNLPWQLDTPPSLSAGFLVPVTLPQWNDYTIYPEVFPWGLVNTVSEVLIYDGQFFPFHCEMIKLSIIWLEAQEGYFIDRVYYNAIVFNTAC